MAGLEGINSLDRAPGSLGVNQSRATDAAKASSATGSGTPAKALDADNDQASLSSAGGLVAQLSVNADVRTEKVAALQAAIANGSYNVPASAVADKLVAHLLNQ